jgi:hypothetical protein
MTMTKLLSLSAALSLLSASMVVEPVSDIRLELREDELAAVWAAHESHERVIEALQAACADYWAASQLRRVQVERGTERLCP